LEVQHDRVAAARRLSREFDAIVILKGAGSVVAGTDGRYAINSTGSPALATAGTGDVLSGMLGALLAQGVAAWDAAVAAVWLHGRAADGTANVGLVASDVAARAAEVLNRLRASTAATLRAPAD
jgi:NAD(P)H-hydrate repair Nnr-like enzyme with NAD(P)H-hydrate dehydratase domain